MSLVENYRGFHDNGPLAHSDPRSVLLSMSEYDKPQSYDVYGEFEHLTPLLPQGRGRRPSACPAGVAPIACEHKAA